MGIVIPFCPRRPRRVDWPVAATWAGALVAGLMFWVWVIGLAREWLS